MDNKVVLITGASRGIGSSIAKKMASKNYNICINYNQSEKEAICLKEEIETHYQVKVEVIKADVSNEEEVKSMINKVIEKFRKIDCLVNNAGISLDTSFESKTVSNFQKIINVNLIGPFLTSKYAYPHLEKSEGTIINISSTNGIDTFYPESLDYDASKAGLISLTKNLAVLFGPKVRVNAIASGWVKTDMTKDMYESQIKEEEKKILLKRFAKPEEIANVVCFLASKDASYINAEVIRVDGGFYS